MCEHLDKSVSIIEKIDSCLNLEYNRISEAGYIEAMGRINHVMFPMLRQPCWPLGGVCWCLPHFAVFKI